jgi:hypothetical protein
MREANRQTKSKDPYKLVLLPGNAGLSRYLSVPQIREGHEFHSCRRTPVPLAASSR